MPEGHPSVSKEAVVGEWSVAAGATVCAQRGLIPVGKYALLR